MGEVYWIVVYCNSPIPGMTRDDEEITEFQDSAIFEDQAHGDKCVQHWLQNGYPVTSIDQYGRKLRYRVSPNIIGAIRFWKPFEFELEGGKVSKISEPEIGGPKPDEKNKP